MKNNSDQNHLNLPPTIRWQSGELYLLDQTRLPLEINEEKQLTIEQVWDSIQKLKVRGAPAIGVAGAYGLLVGLKNEVNRNPSDFLELLESRVKYLDSARPTAVNLKWALDRMLNSVINLNSESTEILFQKLEDEAQEIHQEDIQLCLGMGEAGAPLIQEGMSILTHCNAGALATSGIGTATAPMYVAHQAGVKFSVFADETRPLLQGARLTSWELQQANLDVTLITDNMAGHLMSRGKIDMVITGTDRVAANGDVCNKIGTLGVAIMANYFGIPFYVACPYSTIDLNTPVGTEIEIEERAKEEVTHFGLRQTAPDNIQVRNPAFDVTPNELVTGLITEKGIFKAPFEENLRKQYQS